MPIKDLDVREEEEWKGKPAEDLIPITLYSYELEKVTFVETSFPEKLKDEFFKFLRTNRDVFSWTSSDMPGIDPLLITHNLNVNPDRKPVQQKKRKFSPERQEALKQEVEKLLEVGFIETPFQQFWLLKLMGFEYEVQYKKGVDNIMADALSRVQGAKILCMAISLTNTDLSSFITCSYELDSNLKDIIVKLKNNETISYY